MITLFRIDERLVHGQIAIKWSKHTGADHIVIANDAASNSEIIQKSLMMAVPNGIKTMICSMNKAVKVLNDVRCNKMKILVLVSNARDAVTLSQGISGIPYINVGNYGRIVISKTGKPRKRYGNNLYLNEDELKDFRELITTGLKCVVQTTPEEPAEDLIKVMGQED